MIGGQIEFGEMAWQNDERGGEISMGTNPRFCNASTDSKEAVPVEPSVQLGTMLP